MMDCIYPSFYLGLHLGQNYDLKLWVHEKINSQFQASRRPAGKARKHRNIWIFRAFAPFWLPDLFILRLFLGNSIIISAACEVISVFFASLTGYAVTRLPLPGKLFLMFLIVAISIFPPVSLVDYLFKPMTALGWINTYPARIHVFENRSNENGTQWSD